MRFYLRGFTIESCPLSQKLGPVYMEKTCPAELPWMSHLFLYSLQTWRTVYLKKKVGSPKKLTRLAGSPFFDGRVTLLIVSTFLLINTVARPAESTRSRWSNREFASFWLGQSCQLYFSYKRSPKLTRLREGSLFPWTAFSDINGA